MLVYIVLVYFIMCVLVIKECKLLVEIKGFASSLEMRLYTSFVCNGLCVLTLFLVDSRIVLF